MLKMGTIYYIDTELPFNTTDRSSHMKGLGSKGWELVSVSSDPVSGRHIFFENGLNYKILVKQKIN